jgi:hypothetical protein
MPNVRIARITFGPSAGAPDVVLPPGAQTLNVELNPGDLSWYDALRVELVLTGVGAAEAGDTLDVYFQCRDASNPIWEDRVRFEQLLGTAAVSVAAPEKRSAVLQQFGTLADAEEYGEPSGSAGAARLAAGTVRNGAFPGRYLVKNQPDTSRGAIDRGAAWRFQIVVADANANAAFAGSLHVQGNFAG